MLDASDQRPRLEDGSPPHLHLEEEVQRPEGRFLHLDGNRDPARAGDDDAEGALRKDTRVVLTDHDWTSGETVASGVAFGDCAPCATT
jgi:hypothetical protein